MLTIAAGAGGDPVLYNARRYMGTGLERSITGVGFQPDLVWLKQRTTTDSHKLFDSIRGATKNLNPANNVAQLTTATALTNFENDGFSHGTYGGTNQNNQKQIAWIWKAGGSPLGQGEFIAGSAVMSGTSGAGTISNTATGVSNLTSLTQSVSQTSGFSITKLTGSDTGGNFPHNLGGTPAFIVIKNLDAADAWNVWHQNLGAVGKVFESVPSTPSASNSKYLPDVAPRF